MKRTVPLFFLIFFLQAINGQVETRFFPDGDAFDQVKLIKDHPEASSIKVLPAFNAQKLIEEDEQNEGLDIPFRFGKGMDTQITYRG